MLQRFHRRETLRPIGLPYRPLRSLIELNGVGGLRLRIDERTSERAVSGVLARDAGLAILEAALFAADEPLPLRRIVSVCGLENGAEARKLLRRLQNLYHQEGSAFQVEELAGGFQLLTRPELHPWLARLRHGGHELRLSQPARETLAIIAYRQPIMRADLEAIRGVQCGEILRLLMEKGVIKIVGRHHSLGRPVLYGTTKKFLQHFGLKNLEALPLAEQLKAPAVSDEQGNEPTNDAPSVS